MIEIFSPFFGNYETIFLSTLLKKNVFCPKKSWKHTQKILKPSLQQTRKLYHFVSFKNKAYRLLNLGNFAVSLYFNVLFPGLSTDSDYPGIYRWNRITSAELQTDKNAEAMSFQNWAVCKLRKLHFIYALKLFFFKFF